MYLPKISDVEYSMMQAFQRLKVLRFAENSWKFQMPMSPVLLEYDF